MEHAITMGIIAALGLGILTYILKATGIAYWKWWQKALALIAFVFLVPLLINTIS